MKLEKDYVLGTHEEEIARLGQQHRAWRSRALAAWQSAEVGPGQTVLDVGCGPGYAALDLAELVSPHGRVVAVDKSERFLNILQTMACQRGLDNITTHRVDLDAGEFPEVTADHAWCRWVLAFMKNPRDVLARAAALGPGAGIILYEYFDCATWRTAPRCPELEEFVGTVMASWRDGGGEPDIALSVPRWLEEMGFELRSVRPIINIVQPGQMIWTWLRSFIEVGRHSLVDLGYLSASRADTIWRAFTAFESSAGARMISPGVLEIVAARRITTPPQINLMARDRDLSHPKY